MSTSWCWQAVESRKWAVEEVEKLLQRPEDLKRLDALLEEYTAKHQVRFQRLEQTTMCIYLQHHAIDACYKPVQANKVQLSATVATQVEAARSGIALLDKAHKTLGNMQNSYKVRCLLSLLSACLLQSCS